MTQVEVLLNNGVKVNLNRDELHVNSKIVKGRNTNERKHYVIPFKSIAFIRSDGDIGLV